MAERLEAAGHHLVGLPGVYSQVWKNGSRFCPEICSDKEMNCSVVAVP